MNLFGIAFADQEHDGGGVRRGVIRQAFNPVFIDTATFSNGIHVVSQCQRHNIGFNTVDDGSRLFTRTAMRLADHNVVARFLLPVRAEGLIVLLVQFTRWIVRYVK